MLSIKYLFYFLFQRFPRVFIIYNKSYEYFLGVSKGASALGLLPNSSVVKVVLLLRESQSVAFNILEKHQLKVVALIVSAEKFIEIIKLLYQSLQTFPLPPFNSQF